MFSLRFFEFRFLSTSTISRTAAAAFFNVLSESLWYPVVKGPWPLCFQGVIYLFRSFHACKNLLDCYNLLDWVKKGKNKEGLCCGKQSRTNCEIESKVSCEVGFAFKYISLDFRLVCASRTRLRRYAITDFYRYSHGRYRAISHVEVPDYWFWPTLLYTPALFWLSGQRAYVLLKFLVSIMHHRYDISNIFLYSACFRS